MALHVTPDYYGFKADVSRDGRSATLTTVDVAGYLYDVTAHLYEVVVLPGGLRLTLDDLRAVNDRLEERAEKIADFKAERTHGWQA